MKDFFKREDLDIEEFSILICSGIYNMPTIKHFIDIIEKMGYTTVYLELSFNFSMEEYPYFNYMLSKYTYGELKEIDDYCFSKNIELIPSIQVLGHLGQLSKHAVFNDITDVSGILLVDEPETYKFIETMLKTLLKIFKSKRINLGLDECNSIGSGRYKNLHGDHSESEVYCKHALKVFEIADKYGLKCEMWGDMIKQFADKKDKYFNDFISCLPANVRVHNWYYEISSTEVADKIFGSFKDISNIGFASAAFNFRGIVPNNNFGVRQYGFYFDYCKRYNYKSFMMTTWNDGYNDASIFNILPGLYAASLTVHKKEFTEENLKYFKEITGVDYNVFNMMDIANLPEIFGSRGNKSKYLFYNDILIGNFDCFVDFGYNKAFKSAADKLRSLDFCGYKYMLDLIICLCDILSVKAELGVSIRKAYKDRDFEKLSLCVADLNKIIKLMDRFYKLEEKQWLKERNTYNFEVQCIKIGGLKQRLICARNLLNSYLKGEISIISELEEKQHRYCGDGWSGIDSNYKDEGVFNYLSSVTFADIY